jgi:hypothetical protein
MSMARRQTLSIRRGGRAARVPQMPDARCQMHGVEARSTAWAGGRRRLFARQLWSSSPGQAVAHGCLMPRLDLCAECLEDPAESTIVLCYQYS